MKKDSLNEKEQDTVYNNMQKMYDVSRAMNTASMELITNKTKSMSTSFAKTLSNDDMQPFLDMMESTKTLINEFQSEYEKEYKLNVLNKLLETADTYKRNRSSVEVDECKNMCNKHNDNFQRLKKREKYIIIYSVIFSLCTSTIVLLTTLYIYSLNGAESFINFYQDYFWTTFITPCLIAAFVGVYARYKTFNDKDI